MLNRYSEDTEEGETMTDKGKMIEEYARNLLQLSGFNDLDKEGQEDLLESELILINNFVKDIKNQDYSIITDTVRQGIEKSKEDIGESLNYYRGIIKNLEGQLKKLDNRENEIRNYNQDVNYHRYNLEQEESKLGLFSGKRKKEIEEELNQWKLKEIPPELDQMRKVYKEQIQKYQKIINPLSDRLKEISIYKDILEENQPKNTKEEKKSVIQSIKEIQEEQKTPQEPRERPQTRLELKPLGEVGKIKLKPLRCR